MKVNLTQVRACSYEKQPYLVKVLAIILYGRDVAQWLIICKTVYWIPY